MANTPNLREWQEAWRNQDIGRLARCYALDAVVLHPKKALITGRDVIAAFFQGGLNKVEVSFRPSALTVKDEMAFEYGEFQDRNRLTGEVVATGDYVITWIADGGAWRIKCHAWNSISSV